MENCKCCKSGRRDICLWPLSPHPTFALICKEGVNIDRLPSTPLSTSIPLHCDEFIWKLAQETIGNGGKRVIHSNEINPIDCSLRPRSIHYRDRRQFPFRNAINHFISFLQTARTTRQCQCVILTEYITILCTYTILTTWLITNTINRMNFPHCVRHENVMQSDILIVTGDLWVSAVYARLCDVMYAVVEARAKQHFQFQFPLTFFAIQFQ